MARPLNIDVKPGMFIRYYDNTIGCDVIAKLEGYRFDPNVDNGHTFYIENKSLGYMLKRGEFRLGHKKSELITKREHVIHIDGFSNSVDIVGKAFTKEQLIKEGK